MPYKRRSPYYKSAKAKRMSRNGQKRCVSWCVVDTGGNVRAGYYQYTSVPLINYEIIDSNDLINQRKYVRFNSCQLDTRAYDAANGTWVPNTYLYAITYIPYQTTMGGFTWGSGSGLVYSVPQHLLMAGNITANVGPQYIQIPSMKLRAGDKIHFSLLRIRRNTLRRTW